VLTAAAAAGGFDDVASAALKELRRVQPDISLEWISNEMPFKHEEDRVCYLDGFRRAGLR
jgi:hypothetical protein